ncbi:MAG: hypothetical protein AWU57_26 [Marinobacter sp. T13-3]|nr:MAG: hypothetical protein AWU57_26 [Marinobacter sp. T13-3]
MSEDDDKQGVVYQPKKGAALGARLEFAMMHARLKPADLRRRLKVEHGVTMSKTNTYKLLNGGVERTKYFMEIAEVCNVNARWLATGHGFMTDQTGRLSSREQAAKNIHRLMVQHVVPPNRNDILRLHGRMLGLIQHGLLTPELVTQLGQTLDALVDENEGA